MWSSALHSILYLFFLPKCFATPNTLSEVSSVVVKPFKSTAKSFVQMAAENGFQAETHQVTTEDGYILTLHRIPAAVTCEKKRPVLLIHALLQSSEAFLDSGPEAPGFVIAAECYDTWVGNVRGNYHSRRHISLNPDKDAAFWKFSFDEIGKYDIPAIVDFVLDKTSSEKLMYIGYSQGGGVFMVMLNERPEYVNKISLFVGLAPCTRQLHTTSPLFRGFSLGVKSVQSALEALGIWELLSKDYPVQGSISALCKIPLLAPFTCSLATAEVDSPHPESVTPEIETRLYEHAPAGTSTMNMAHYGQGMTNKKFYKFDYGTVKNSKVYGSAEPPAYDFAAVNVPTVIYHGPADRIAVTEDLDWAVSQLPNVLEYIKIKDPLWNHYDLVYSRYWKDTIFSTLKDYLSQYDHE